MLYPRLFVARQLLSEDGIIFISIDDHEVHNLRQIMNEIFGEENYLGLVTVVNNLKGRSDDRFFATANEYLLVFARSAKDCEILGLPLPEAMVGEYDQEDQYGKYKEIPLKKTGKGWRRADRPNMFYPIYYSPVTGEISLQPLPSSISILPMREDEEGRWRWGKETFFERKDRDLVIRQVRGGHWNVFTKMRLGEGDEERTLTPKTLWLDPKFDTAKGSEALRRLLGAADLIENPKPVDLIKEVARISTSTDDLILDFFAGSGTTAHAVTELNIEDGGNRRFALIQLPATTPSDSAARNAGYSTIAQLAEERVRRSMERLNDNRGNKLDVTTLETPADRGFRVFKLAPSDFLTWRPPAEQAPDAYASQLELFTGGLDDEWDPQNVIWEVAIKEGFSLSSDVGRLELVEGNTIFKVTHPDKGQHFLICLDDTIDLEAVKLLELNETDLFICRDTALDDTTAANLALQCRLKTI